MRIHTGHLLLGLAVAIAALFVVRSFDSRLDASPLNDPNADQYMRVGTPSWGHVVDIPASGNVCLTRRYQVDASVGLDLEVLEWGDLLSVAAGSAGAVCACLTMNPAVTFSFAACGAVADPGTPADGTGPCFEVAASGRHDVKVSELVWPTGIAQLTDTPGYCDGRCSQTTGNTSAPCCTLDGGIGNANCFHANGDAGTCSRGAHADGAHLCFAGSAATRATVTVER